MPSKITDQSRFSRYWQPPYWEYPRDEANHINLLHQSWTNDLLISGGNHGSPIRNGLMGHGAPDRGGSFLVHKRDYEENILNGGEDAHFATGYNDPFRHGNPHFQTNQWPWKHEFNSSNFPLPNASSDDELQALGATAIARCKPGKSISDASTFIGELKEGLPSAVGLAATGKARARQARNAGDEYLNVEFGWKPLLRDVRSFASAYRNAHRAWQKYRKGAGVWIRRGYDFETKLKIEEESLGYHYPMPLLHPWCYSSTAGPLELRLLKSEKVERWFRGTFVYDIPDMSNMFGHIKQADYLYGARPDPETLWNIAPWSWAADWVGNIGDNISNLTSFMQDGLVMHHAYMMEHCTNVYEYKMTIPEDYWMSHPQSRILSQKFTAETKKRIGATPYGFGANWDDFTSKQLAILGSLGISRAK